jgi:hypothetical protein
VPVRCKTVEWSGKHGQNRKAESREWIDAGITRRKDKLLCGNECGHLPVTLLRSV